MDSVNIDEGLMYDEMKTARLGFCGCIALVLIAGTRQLMCVAAQVVSVKVVGTAWSIKIGEVFETLPFPFYVVGKMGESSSHRMNSPDLFQDLPCT